MVNKFPICRGLAVLVCVLAGPASAQETSGVFRSAIRSPMGASPTEVASGDFDKDGVLDLVSTNAGPGGNSLVVAIGFDDATLSAFPALPVGSFPSDLVSGFFDADDNLDLIVANANDSAVVFVRGTGTKNPSPPDNRRFFAAPGAPIRVGMGPRALAAADLNADGRLDVAVGNEGATDQSVGSVTILLGQGDGTFVRVDQDPDDPDMLVNDLLGELGTRAVAIGEVSGDSILDVLALNLISGTISIFFGNGDGTFVAGVIQTVDGAQDIALDDLNGDGELDLVTADTNADQVSVRLGNGDGTFGSADSYRTGTAPARIAIHRVNGDAFADLVTANSRSQDVSLFAGRGDGTFDEARTFVADAEPRALAFGKFDDDDLEDVAVVCEGASGATAAILRGRSDGLLHGAEDIDAGGAPTDLVAGDVNSDAMADLVAVTEGGDLLVYRSTGARGLGPATPLLVGGRPRGLALADLNGDLRLDVAIADIENDVLLVALGKGDGTFGGVRAYPTAREPANVASGDFNDDGRVDLAVTAVTNGEVSVFLQTSGAFDFAPARNTDVGSTPIDIETLDANCDGRDDAVVANNAGNTVQVLISNAAGVLSVHQTLDASVVGDLPDDIAIGDYNSDGIEDLAVSNARSTGGQSSVHFFYGDCSGDFTAGAGNLNLSAGLLVTALAARDFTGDQITDVASVNQAGNVVRVFLGRGSNGAGDGGFSGRIGDTVSRMPEVLAAGDFDDDGRYDVVAGNTDPSAGNVSVMLNCSREPTCHPFGFAPAGMAATRGDGNDDGTLSAADVAAVAAEVIDGDGDQVEAVETGFFTAVAGVDANGDGRVDEQDAHAVARRIFAGT